MAQKNNDIIDRSSDLPLHQQVADHIASLITNGNLRIGDELPSEAQLVDFFGVSRSVVRQAYASLVASGVIRTQKGRPARVISGDRADPARDIAQAGGLAEDFRRRGKELVTNVLSVKRVEAPDFVQENAFVKDCWESRRIRIVDDEPIMYVINWVPFSILPDLSKQTLTGASLHGLIRATGVELVGGMRRIRAMNPTPEVAKMLEVAADTPLLQVTGSTQTVDNELAEAFEIWHHPSFELETYASVQGASASSQLEPVHAALARLEEAIGNLTTYNAIFHDGN